MKVSITWDWTAEERRALAAYYGEEGLASHKTCWAWMMRTLETTWEDIPNPDFLPDEDE